MARKPKSKADRIEQMYCNGFRKCDIARKVKTPYSYVNAVINRRNCQPA